MKTKTKPTTKKVLSPIRVGNAVLIRTVTHYHTGRIALVTKEEIVLTEAAWIADTGRFSETLKGTSTPMEVEPFAEPVSVNRGAIVDVTNWIAPLPLDVK